MHSFMALVLAFVLGFFGAIALSYIPKELIANSQLIRESPGELVSSESTENNAVEVKGVRFEILVPERVWIIPPNQSGTETPVKIGIRITNNTQTPLRFTRFDTLIPKLVDSDGKVVRNEGGRNVTLLPAESDCPIVQPGENITFFLDGKLTWRNSKLQLGGSDGFGGIWLFDNLKPGNYQFQFIYDSPSSRRLPCELALGEIEPKESMWIGRVATTFVEIHFAQP